MQLQQTNGLNGRGHHQTGYLPRDTPQRESFIGIAITKGTKNGLIVRFSVSKELLDKIGKPARIAVRGTPENGYFIEAGNDLKPIPASPQRFYIYMSVEKANAPKGEREAVWLRAEIEGKRIRIPPSPPAWISGDPEFQSGAICEETDRELQLGKTAGDDAVRLSSTSAPIAATVLEPKPAFPAEYRLPDNIGIAEAQALLGKKLDEARSIMKALEARTGMRLTLTRNFQITLDLSGK